MSKSCISKITSVLKQKTSTEKSKMNNNESQYTKTNTNNVKNMHPHRDSKVVKNDMFVGTHSH